MAPEDLAARLDMWAGRSGAPRRPPDDRRRAPRGRKPSRTGLVAAGLLIAALAAGWLVIGSRGTTAAPARAADAEATSSTAPPSTAATSTSTLRALLRAGRSCIDVRGSVPEITCVVDKVRVEARLVDKAAAAAVYVAASGARIARRAGPADCAAGRDDERAWSRPAAPARIVGRYRCRREGGRAAMWWTDEHGIVAHAVAADGDLASLFAWWRAHLDA